MDIKRTIKELSQNEKKVLLALKTLHGTGSPEDIFKNGDFDQEVEVANAASWLQSKKLILTRKLKLQMLRPGFSRKNW